MAPIPLSQDARVGQLEGRMAYLEDRMDALNTKIDVSTEAVRGDIKLVLERVDSLGAEMRREFATVRKEHQADRQLIVSVLKDHGMRLRALESAGPSSPPDGGPTEEPSGGA
jgi:hypothetical protein